MSKIVNDTHIVGERGAIRLAEYCNQHKPYLIFRQVSVNDFGIDGEIELTEINENNKTTPTAQIIKVQIKSTAKDNSYMKKETENSFEFYAKPDDIDYWLKYYKYGIKVLLVVFDDRTNSLYCKEISNIDLASAKPEKGRQSLPITFDKIENLLELGKHNFLNLFAKAFSGRVKHEVSETIVTNIHKFKSFPKLLFSYKSLYTDKRTIRNLIEDNETPYYTIYSDTIYSFSEIENRFVKFKNSIFINPIVKTQFSWSEIIEQPNLKNIYIELLNLYFKDFMGKKGIAYSKDFNRYYFKLNETLFERKAKYTTRQKGQLGEITVVKDYNYGKDSFFRHKAIELKIIFIENDIFLLINNQWFFTSDRKSAIAPELISKYSNGINNMLHNKELLDSQHFWWSYLSWNYTTKNDNEMLVFDGKPINEQNIIIAKVTKENVNFGIYTDNEYKTGNVINKKNSMEFPIQKTIFDI